MSQDNYCKWCKGTGELTKRTIRGGAIQIITQCTTCGSAIGSAVAKDKVGDWSKLPAWDETLQEKYSQRRSEEFQRQQEEEREAFFDWYNEYLKTPEWAEKRQRVIERAGGICEGCRRAPINEVHHLTYSHVGRELLFQLVGLCHGCHEEAHDSGRDEVTL